MINKAINILHDLVNTLEGCIAGENIYPDTLLGYAREALGYLEDDTPITEEFLNQKFKKYESIHPTTGEKMFHGWLLPWTGTNGVSKFCLNKGTTAYFIEDHFLMPLKTIGDLKLAFYLMGKYLNDFINN